MSDIFSFFSVAVSLIERTFSDLYDEDVSFWVGISVGKKFRSLLRFFLCVGGRAVSLR